MLTRVVKSPIFLTTKRQTLISGREKLAIGSMKQIQSQLILCVLVVLLAVCATGCLLFAAGAAAGAGVAGYKYGKGELKSTEPASLDQTWDATLAAAQDISLPIVSQTKDALHGHLVSRTANDKKVDIDLKKVSDANTEVSIRVGTFGDEAMSHTILDAIRKRLGTGVAAS